MNPIELFLSDGRSAKVWACGECKCVKKAEVDARLCCEPWTCNTCGLGCDKYRTQCDGCQRIDAGVRRAKRIEAAEEVTDYHGWVFCDEVDGHNNGYWPSLEEFIDYVCDDFEGIGIPEFVYCCKSEAKELCIVDIVQTLLSDIDEEAADLIYDSLEGMAELEAAVEKWNMLNEQRLSVYEADYKRKVRVNYKGNDRD